MRVCGGSARPTDAGPARTSPRGGAGGHGHGLTEEGSAELERQRAALSAGLAEVLDHWGDVVAELVSLLDRFTRSVASYEQPPAGRTTEPKET